MRYGDGLGWLRCLRWRLWGRVENADCTLMHLCRSSLPMDTPSKTRLRVRSIERVSESWKLALPEWQLGQVERRKSAVHEFAND